MISTNLNTDVGPRFMNISNADLATMARSFGAKLDSAATVRVVGNERRMTALVSLPSHVIQLPDSNVFPRLMLSNDNTGRRSLRINVGLFRLICSNGLAIGVPGFSFGERVRHVWSENQRAKVLDIPMVAERVLEYLQSGAVEEQIELAQDTRVADPIQVVGSLPIGERAKQTAIDNIILERTRSEDDVRNAWGLYNVVNEAVRLRSRSEYTALAKDEGLLLHILTLAA